MNDSTNSSVCNNDDIVSSEPKKIGRPRKHPERQYYKSRDIEKTREYQREYKRKKLGCIPRDLSKSDRLKVYISKLTEELKLIQRPGRLGFSEDF
jgi:hypothetical protein